MGVGRIGVGLLGGVIECVFKGVHGGGGYEEHYAVFKISSRIFW